VRTDRHIVEYTCDQCAKRVMVFDEEHYPLDEDEWPLTPSEWFSVCYDRRDPVHLCSVECLRAYANKLEAKS